MKDIIIKCFRTLEHCYFYDRYTDSVVKVNPDEYNILKKVEEEGKITVDDDLSKFIENGLLHKKGIKNIKHSATDVIEYYAANKVQQLILQVTQQCNLRCFYCAYSGNYYNRKHSDKRMSFEVAKRAIDFYFDHSGEMDDIRIAFYGGEPLLEFSLIKRCVEYVEAKTIDKSISFYITTNGTLFTDQMITFLSEHKVYLTISLDGNKEEHDINRKFRDGKGSFDLIMSNLQRIKDYDEEYFSKIRYNAVINPKVNLKNVLTFFAKSKLINCWKVRLSVISDSGVVNKSMLKTDDSFWIPYKYERMKLLLYLIGKLKYKDINPCFVENENEIKRLYKVLHESSYEGTEMHHGGPCLAGIRRLFVNTSGSFYPCERVSESLSEMEIGTINNGYDYNKIRMIMNIGKLTQERCLECWNLRHCKICIGQIEPINNKITCKGKLLLCPQSEKDALDRFRELCVLVEHGYNAYKEREDET